MGEKNAVKGKDFMELVRYRTSCRNYRREPVPSEHIERMLEAARVAPSACNQQPWRFAVVEDAAVRERLVKDSFLPGIPMPWAIDAPVIIALGIQKNLAVHRMGAALSGVKYAQQDAGISGEHLVLQATELGLGTCWIGWIKPRVVRRLIGWSRSVQPLSLITVGWPAGERKTRSRMALEEMVKWI